MIQRRGSYICQNVELLGEAAKEVVEKALKKLRKNKSPGKDGMAAELFKKEEELLCEEWLKVWREEELPEDLKEDHITYI